MPHNFDSIIIGTGQSGVPLATRLAKNGQKVAIIERLQFGGTCVNTGCIPTKAMVASARVAYLAGRAADFGVRIEGPIQVDMAKVMARKEEISAASRNAIKKTLESTENCTVFRGQARFLSNKEVAVDGDRLAAKQIFINVGGRAARPKFAGIDDVPYFTNSSILEINFLPENLIIIGGSYIGLEFGQMFRRFGSRVSIVERSSRLLSHEDEDVSEGVSDILRNEGIDIHLNAGQAQFSRDGNTIRVRLNGSGSTVITGSHVLVAAGRRPNTDDLGLENTGIRMDERGFIQVNDLLETDVAEVWAMGDCNGRGAFTHTSYNDYEIVADHLFNNGKRRVTDRIIAYCVYIDPPLGRIGMTEAEVRKTGKKALMAKREMSKVGRAYEKSETQGFMKILVDDQSKQILGASILGTGGDEAIHCLLDTMYAKAPSSVLEHAMHIHPTVSELIPTMLGALEPLC